MELGDRLGIVGLIVALIATGITILFPTKRWIGWTCFGVAGLLFISWGILEYKATHPGGAKFTGEIDALLRLDGPLQVSSGPGWIPMPTTPNDSYVLIIGTLRNNGDTPAIVLRWHITYLKPDGEEVGGLVSNPSDLDTITAINPDTHQTVIVKASDYWPRKMDMQSIPAKGVSYGFIYGLVKGVGPEFDQRRLTLHFEDTDQKQYSIAYTPPPQ